MSKRILISDKLAPEGAEIFRSAGSVKSPMLNPPDIPASSPRFLSSIW